MDAARVFVWRVRFLLLATAMGLVGVGGDRSESGAPAITVSQSPVSQSPVSQSPVSQSPPPVPMSAVPPPTHARVVHVVVASSPPRSLAEPVKHTRVKTADVVQVARKPATVHKPGGRKLTTAHANPSSKKREASIAAGRSGSLAKSRVTVARKADAKPVGNVAAARPARQRPNA